MKLLHKSNGFFVIRLANVSDKLEVGVVGISLENVRAFASVDCHFLIFQAAQFHHRCNRYFSNSPAGSNDASSTFNCSGYSPVSLSMSKLPESEGKIAKFLILLHSA